VTKLDEEFVKAGLAAYPEAAYYINTLAEEVRRLESLGARYEAALEKIGRMENAPVIARLAIRPINEKELMSRLGPTLGEQFGVGP
jgi:hypothetical protein